MMKLNKEKIWLWSMEAGAKLGCHQMPERSFFCRGYQFPVYARCTGILVSFPIAYAALCLRKKIPTKLCALLVVTMVMDGSLQYMGIKESTNKRRFLIGICGGFGMTILRWEMVFGIGKRIAGDKNRE